MPTYCPQCRAIRQPNGTFCHMCGYSYLTKESVPLETRGPANIPPEFRLTFGDGFRFGAGFITVAIIVSAVISVLSWVALGAVMQSIMSRFGG